MKLINYLRKYVSFYIDIFKLLQARKTELLRNELIARNARKIYFDRTRIQNLTDRKITFFKTLQDMLSKFFYLIHVNIKQMLFIDLNVNKEFEFDVMIYYVKKKWLQKTFADEKHDYSSRIAMKSILFFNRLLNFAEIKYWSIELEIIDIMWIFKKVRHLIETSISTIIIYIDHDAALEIAK